MPKAMGTPASRSRDTWEIGMPRMRSITMTSGVLAVVLVVLLGFAGYLWHLSTRLPDLQADAGSIEMAETSVVYAADGAVLAEWYDAEDRTVVPNDVIPEPTHSMAPSMAESRYSPRPIFRLATMKRRSHWSKLESSNMPRNTEYSR